MNDLYPEGMRRPDADERDAEIAVLRKTLVIKRITLFLVVVLLAIVLGGVAILVVQIRNTQQTGSPVVKNTNALIEQQQDCLTAGGTCYEENQRRLALVLGSVRTSDIQVSAAATACAVALVRSGGPVTYTGVHQCLIEALPPKPRQ